MIEEQSWDHPLQSRFDTRVLARLQTVLDAWVGRGWVHVPLPWMVPERHMAATRPQDAPQPEPATHEGPLVASGEQAFLWLDAHDRLPPAQHGWIGWTPCFRHERYDALHHHYFLKAELFAWTPELDVGAVHRLARQVAAAWHDLAQLEARDSRARFTWLPTGALSGDLLLDGVELGSYGVRPRENQRGWYLYGTALAEPRWSQAWDRRTGAKHALP